MENIEETDEDQIATVADNLRAIDLLCTVLGDLDALESKLDRILDKLALIKAERRTLRQHEDQRG